MSKTIQTTEDYHGVPSGSVIHVTHLLKDHYRGDWSSMAGTYPIKVPKSICIPYVDPIKKAIRLAAKQGVGPAANTIQRRVVCSANRVVSKGVEYLALGPRHFSPTMHKHITLFKRLKLGTKTQWLTSEQGFIDQFGVFMTREQAHVVAKAANQIVRRCGGDTTQLFSESIY